MLPEKKETASPETKPSICNGVLPAWYTCWCNTGTSVLGVTNHSLTGFRNPCLTLLRWPRPWEKIVLGENQTISFYYKTALKWLLKTFFQTHTLVPHSAIIREAPSYSSWELTQRTTKQHAETKRCWNTPSKMECLHKPLFSELRELSRKGCKKIVWVRSDRWLQGNSVFQMRQDRHTYELIDCSSMLSVCAGLSQTRS